MPAPLPPDEAARLEALRKYDILDSAPDAFFDDLVLLASTITGSPIAAFTLIDAERQWFKASQGLADKETTRDEAFCAYTILGDDLMVVPDATRDLRFAENRFVVKDPGIRFYAGAPVRSREGLNLGSICVIDRQPRRSLLEHQRLALKAIACQASALLELRRTAAELAGALRDFRTLSRLLPICSNCRRIRDGENAWHTAEEALQQSGAQFSSALCPDCLRMHYPEYADGRGR
ncbi:MAG: diguanylate cyclase [Gemmatimonas sp.]|nr:diguanylate cyclase [Gemmatimonas sp.]